MTQTAKAQRLLAPSREREEKVQCNVQQRRNTQTGGQTSRLLDFRRRQCNVDAVPEEGLALYTQLPRVNTNGTSESLESTSLFWRLLQNAPDMIVNPRSIFIGSATWSACKWLKHGASYDAEAS
jgi:hypothetical protein